MDGRRRGFTLMELVVVIAVIGLLAGLTAPAVFRHLADARVAAAKSDLATLSLALESFALTTGAYPSTAEGLEALVSPGGHEPALWKGPYLKGRVPVDPWQRPYVYVGPGDVGPETFDLRTFGRDGKPGGTGEAADLVAGEVRAR